jgi:lipoprotein-anchoring transpeptidase ErfK/SrfK
VNRIAKPCGKQGPLHRAAHLLLAALAATCADERGEKDPPAYDAAVPADAIESVDLAALEAQRHDTTWRAHADRDRRQRLGRRHTPVPPAPRPAADTTAPPLPVELVEEVTGQSGTDPRRPSVLHVQVLLDRIDFSPGVIDGRWGKNVEKAVYWFQHEQGLEPTGRLDDETYRRLLDATGDPATTRRYRVRKRDLDGPFVDIPPGIYEQARQPCLCYTSPLERLSERFHTTPELLRRLNPDLDLDTLGEGTLLQIPDVREARKPRRRIATILVSTRGFYTHALDEDGGIVFHFPSTLGSRYSPTPTGTYRVAAIVAWPRFHFTPNLFFDVPDDRPETVLPAGPNSPIGTVWIELSRPYYGIHGTAAPATIGYVTSHGCVRLTNWDAWALARHIEPGLPVEFR